MDEGCGVVMGRYMAEFILCDPRLNSVPRQNEFKFVGLCFNGRVHLEAGSNFEQTAILSVPVSWAGLKHFPELVRILVAHRGPYRSKNKFPSLVTSFGCHVTQ